MTIYTSYTTHRGKILLSYRDDHGKKHNRVVENFRPWTFIPSTDESSPYRSILDKPLEKVIHNSMWDARQHAIQYKGVDGYEVHGYDRFDRQFIHSQFRRNDWSMEKIRCGFFDIETEVGEGFPDPRRAEMPINIATFYDTFDHKFHVFTWQEVTDRKEGVEYHVSADEREMLLELVAWIARREFDAIVGFNSAIFDIPYLINRIVAILGEEVSRRLSPFGVINSREVRDKWDPEKTHTIYTIAGLEHIDYREIFLKFGNERLESYSLDFIAKHVTGKEKLKHHSGIPGHLLYRDYFDAAVDYNVQDVRLLVEIDDRKKLLSLVFELAYLSLINYTETTSPVRMWESIIHMELADENVFFPYHKTNRPKYPYEGGFVKSPEPGKYRWVGSFDVTSEYPSLIMAMNMSPETILNRKIKDVTVDRVVIDQAQFDVPEGVCFSGTGQMFAKDRWGFMARITKKYFGLRKKYKDEMLGHKRAGRSDEAGVYDTKQNAVKVLLNSLYGAAANEHFHFFDIRIAEAITLSGQCMIRWIARDVNRALNRLLGTEGVDYCIAIDTDSNYFNFAPVVDRKWPQGNPDRKQVLEWLREFTDVKVQSIIKQSIANFAEYFRCYDPSALSMKRECIADVAVFTRKKRYFLNVLDKEGVEKEELKIMGLEAVKSSTPEWCRENMKKVFEFIVHGTEKDVQDFVKQKRLEFRNLRPREVAENMSVNGISKYLSPSGSVLTGAPMNTKASIAFNSLLKSANVESKYDRIREGDKIKIVMLKTPNPAANGAIAFKVELPEEFGVDKYLDYDKMFDKLFVGPIQSVLEEVDWNIEPKADLGDLFG